MVFGKFKKIKGRPKLSDIHIDNSKLNFIVGGKNGPKAPNVEQLKNKPTLLHHILDKNPNFIKHYLNNQT